MFDNELAGGFQDADFEMREFEAAANRERYLQSIGKCSHGWSGPNGKQFECYNCGFIGAEEQFPDRMKIREFEARLKQR